VVSAQLLQAGQLLVRVQGQIAPLLSQGLLVERRQLRVVLGQHPAHPTERPLLGIGQVSDDLDDGALPRGWPATQPSLVNLSDQGSEHDWVARRVLRISWRRSSMASLPAHARCWWE
jgi:hypothetical protein